VQKDTDSDPTLTAPSCCVPSCPTRAEDQQAERSVGANNKSVAGRQHGLFKITVRIAMLSSSGSRKDQCTKCLGTY
jgi:hypothetical protein